MSSVTGKKNVLTVAILAMGFVLVSSAIGLPTAAFASSGHDYNNHDNCDDSHSGHHDNCDCSSYDHSGHHFKHGNYSSHDDHGSYGDHKGDNRHDNHDNRNNDHKN